MVCRFDFFRYVAGSIGILYFVRLLLFVDCVWIQFLVKKMMLHNEWRKFILFVIPFYYPLSTWASFPFHRVSSLERLNGGIHSNNGNSFVYAVFCLALCVRLKNTWMRFWEFTKVLFTSEEYGWLPNIYLFISSIFIHLQHNGELDVSCMKCIFFQLRYTAAPIRCNRARNIPEL